MNGWKSMKDDNVNHAVVAAGCRRSSAIRVIVVAAGADDVEGDVVFCCFGGIPSRIRGMAVNVNTVLYPVIFSPHALMPAANKFSHSRHCEGFFSARLTTTLDRAIAKLRFIRLRVRRPSQSLSILEVCGNTISIPVPSHSHWSIPIPIPVY